MSLRSLGDTKRKPMLRGWFASSVEFGLEFYETAEEARAAAMEALRQERAHAVQNCWGDEVEEIVWGRVIERAKCITERPMPRGHDADIGADYALVPVASAGEVVSTTSTLLDELERTLAACPGGDWLAMMAADGQDRPATPAQVAQWVHAWTSRGTEGSGLLDASGRKVGAQPAPPVQFIRTTALNGLDGIIAIVGNGPTAIPVMAAIVRLRSLAPALMNEARAAVVLRSAIAAIQATVEDPDAKDSLLEAIAVAGRLAGLEVMQLPGEFEEDEDEDEDEDEPTITIGETIDPEKPARTEGTGTTGGAS